MNDKINIKELLDIKSFKGKTSVWVCRDWAGPHIFAEKPKRINDPANEWYASVASLDNVRAVRDMVRKFTKGWDINHEPEEITINLEIKL